MVVNLPSGFPATEALLKEGIDLCSGVAGGHCRRSPLRVAVLNLMPLKQMTEVDLLRILGVMPFDLELHWMKLDTHVSRNTSQQHLDRFYRGFTAMEHERFDGFIVTGAPVEKLDYEQVDYWPELCRIFSWSRTHVSGSSLFVCWGALAALNYFYGIPKYVLKHKISGVFPHWAVDSGNPLLRGFDDVFYVPHSRYGSVMRADIEHVPQLKIVAEGDTCGVHMVQNQSGSQVFVTGHAEYAPMTLDFEYHRDLDKGIEPAIPANYYPDDNAGMHPRVLWRGHAHLMFQNWLSSCFTAR